MRFHALQDAKRGYLMTLHVEGCRHVTMAPNRDDAQPIEAATIDEAVEIAGSDYAEAGESHPSDWVEVAPCLGK